MHRMYIISETKTSKSKTLGYGGGYNDRGIVQYKDKKNDSDDEYDEFGRRKRKHDENRSSSSKSSEKERSKPTTISHENEDSEDDEEDEEDEEGDLSKYDLWGSDTEKPAEDKEEPKQRYRSRSPRSK